ncbi:hypothetical protein ACFX14_039884 [Malus domestica]
MWLGARLILSASGIIFPIIKAEGVRQMFFSATIPAYYRVPPVHRRIKRSTKHCLLPQFAGWENPSGKRYNIMIIPTRVRISVNVPRLLGLGESAAFEGNYATVGLAKGKIGVIVCQL